MSPLRGGRWIAAISLSLAIAVGLIGCDDKQGAQKVVRPSGAANGAAGSAGATDTIKIASFNIQVFGTSKLKKPKVMDGLAKVVRRFDVVAIQEIRSTDDSVMPKFVQMINADGSHYDFIVGPRLGRTNSKEQYAFVFNTSHIEADRGSAYTVPDPRALLHREPFVVRFRARGQASVPAFSFNLVNIHTDPDETTTELNALADVFTSVQKNGSGEDDVILLGDLNVDDRHLGNLGRLPGITAALSGVTSNTRKTKLYDNIVFDRRATAEYTGRWGVLDLMTEFGLTQQQALEVSDHMPVWAEFRTQEVTGAGAVALH
ncbi:MAG: endonuclease/exonuclease/phosphatase [Planctomycetes bacterium]|nr:endonuclease/exonuclease/phosphatase [Planctomycetota bacterium]